MFKFFVPENQIKENNAKIIGEDVKHISNVLRLKKDEQIIICNKDNGKSYICRINELNKEYVICKIDAEIENTTESNVNVDIYQGIPKSDKMEYIIQKATEIGVRSVIPVELARCIAKIDEKSEKKKIDRWQKIAEGAAKQSKRDRIPKIENVINIKKICKIIPKYDIILVAYENEQNITLKDELKKLDRNKKLEIGIVIGPEGGLSENEVEELVKNGAKCVTLGKRILRTETAALVILSDIMYEFEM